MKVVGDGWTASGRAVDLRGRNLDPGIVVAAVRRTGDERQRNTSSDGTLRVTCQSPGPLHECVGLVTPETTVRTRRALAAVARERGYEPPNADAIARLESRVAAVDAETESGAETEAGGIDRRTARRRVAEAGAREEELREHVAALRGRVQERRTLDAPAEGLVTELQAAIRELSDIETERIAAEELLETARQVAAADRDARERRLGFADDLANERRRARTRLAERVHDEFAAALETVPGDARADGSPGTYEGDSVTAALAVARVARVRAPVVLACDRFDSAADAAQTLRAPVVTV